MAEAELFAVAYDKGYEGDVPAGATDVKKDGDGDNYVFTVNGKEQVVDKKGKPVEA